MSLVCWIALGLIAGFAASKIANKLGYGRPMDVAAGIAGAIIGGLLFDAAWHSPVVTVNLWSLPVAGAASGLALCVWHGFIRRA